MSIVLDGSTGITTPNIISPTQTISTKLDLTGGQIKFPATQVPSSDANTLDDYEEGTWTPKIEGKTTSGVGTYATQAGHYTKIGNMIKVSCFIQWTAHTGTGEMLLTGLPYASGNITQSIASALSYSVSLGSGSFLSGWISPNNYHVTLIKQETTGGTWSAVLMDTDGYITLSIVYSTT